MSNSLPPCEMSPPGSFLSMGFPRQEYWSGFWFPSSGDCPSPGIEPMSPAWQADSLLLSHLGSPNAIYMLAIALIIRYSGITCLGY